eukprot:TRINITY_DN4476_c0_g3_i1.p4 TRINITY_DN4476_c0_g3~~TRINITY_DN4476_c0_g3_i1.p4  ORF type:complete len:103 (-),score=8.14 TRINITY_DN4476_c0_g3_i1:1361-1669(-)
MVCLVCYPKHKETCVKCGRENDYKVERKAWGAGLVHAQLELLDAAMLRSCFHNLMLISIPVNYYACEKSVESGASLTHLQAQGHIRAQVRTARDIVLSDTSS